MRNITLVAVAFAMTLSVISPAQTDTTTVQSTTIIVSGPWRLHKSTGDHAYDRLAFIMDRTLNATEIANLKQLFWSLPGPQEHMLQKSILVAIDNNAKNVPEYNAYYSKDWGSDNGMTDYDAYMGLTTGLGSYDRAAIYNVNPTSSQMEAIIRLIKCGGWANSVYAEAGYDRY